MRCVRSILIVSLVTAVPTLSGCSLANLFTAEEEVEESFDVAGVPQVVVNTFNGQIDVTTGSGDTVLATVTKRGSGSSQEAADADLDNIEVDMSREGNKIRITARSRDQKIMGNRGARVKLEVPTGSVLDLHTTNGKVTAIGEMGDVAVHSSNGAIQVKGSKGKLNLDTSNGSITAEGGQGRADLNTSNGSIECKAKEALVTAHTSNGNIRFAGTLAAGDHSLESSNGRIVLTLPADARFRLDAQTSNGKVSNAFSLSKTEAVSKNRVRGTIGENPAATVKLHTSNGHIEISQE
jgi:DUF4097 and DUF4098 domain-containing protein YvlB